MVVMWLRELWSKVTEFMVMSEMMELMVIWLIKDGTAGDLLAKQIIILMGRQVRFGSLWGSLRNGGEETTTLFFTNPSQIPSSSLENLLRFRNLL